MSRCFIPSLLTLTTAAALAGCNRADAAKGSAAAAQQPATAGAAVPHMVVVTAREFAFDAPDSIPAGLTTIRLVDAGHQLHHVQLIKLENGKTPSDLAHALQSGGPWPAWASLAGGANPPTPGGGETSTTLDIKPGNYAMICLIPGPDGVPHVMKGMMRPLTVTPSAGAAATAPRADVTVHLTDYSFALSTPLTAGTHTIHIVNDGPQPHELFLARLAPGKTAAELAEWADKQQGPPPGIPMGGVSAMNAGMDAFVTANFTPGNYALLCFVPDAKDGKPHVMHGMVRQITIN